jgi:AraC-like DNA-binding protein
MARRSTERRRKALADQAERVIRARYAEPDLSLGDVAEEVGTSPRQLQRALREAADTGFQALLLRVRMEAARRLLSRKRNGLTVKATARSVGYRGPSGLVAACQRFYGKPPSAFQPDGAQYLGDFDEPEIGPPITYL